MNNKMKPVPKTSQEILEIQRKNEIEMNDASLYKHMIKKICFLCDEVCNKKKSFAYYQVYGNCCTACSTRIERKAKKNNYRLTVNMV